MMTTERQKFIKKFGCTPLMFARKIRATNKPINKKKRCGTK